MLPRTLKLSRLLLLIFFLASASSAVAVNTWYVDGVNGNDSNDCMSSSTACKTIGHAIALAHWNDVIMVAPATYAENLTITKSLKIYGSRAATTIVDGNWGGSVFTISNAKARVYFSKLTILRGTASSGGGINNSGSLTIDHCVIRRNKATKSRSLGAGIFTSGNLTINNSTISNNGDSVHWHFGGGIGVDGGTTTINKSTVSGNQANYGGGIYVQSGATVTVNRSTVSENHTTFLGGGAGILVVTGTITINNSTIGNNDASGQAGGIHNVSGTMKVNNSTISGNSAVYGGLLHNAGGIFVDPSFGQWTGFQNTIVANNPGGDCYGDITSNGYNLSSDGTCNFTGPGDMINTDPKLGLLGYHGGPTKTIPIQQGSPAIDAGNPTGCTDSDGNLLKTDQRGFIRPDHEQSVGCDIGAFERQKNK